MKIFEELVSNDDGSWHLRGITSNTGGLQIELERINHQLQDITPRLD